MQDNYEVQDSFLLTEGAIVERLKREFYTSLDNDIVHAGFYCKVRMVS